MNIYYVESYSAWYLVKAANAKSARSDGVKKFGRGMVKKVRLATDDEIKYFKAEISEA